MKALIAEDSVITRELLQTALAKWGYDVTTACDGDEAFEVFSGDDPPQLAVLDWTMPKLDGVEVCRRVRERNAERYSYIILLSEKHLRDTIVEGLRAGADDFVSKPFDLRELEQRLRAGRRIVELQDQLLRTQASLKDQATHDTLTGLLNRGAIIDVLTQELNRCGRREAPVSVVMADIDHFKRINDTWGHQAGDHALQQAARTIRKSIRKYNMVGRYGGEEFLVVLPEVDQERAMIIAERIRGRLSEEIIKIDTDAFSISGSFGVASTSQMEAVELDELVLRADSALYRAKRDGRDCVREHTSESLAVQTVASVTPASSPKGNILVVDDEPGVREVVARWLGDQGWHCIQAANADTALECLRGNDVRLVTLDINLPGRSGMDLLTDIKEHFPDTEIVMLTGAADTVTAIDALTHGACGYLIKPIEREQLVFEVAKGLERQQLLAEKRRQTQQLESRVCQQSLQISEAHEETILRLVTASMYRDEETGAHIRRVGLFSELLAETLGWPAGDVERIRFAAPMHDVGKIGIPDAILQKPGKLTKAEFEIMKTHTTIGARMLDGSTSPVLQMAHQIALSHHERWDGKGYPQGMAGASIPEAARIVAIVDVYDALSHDRVYRPAMPEKQVLEILTDGRGTHFDPTITDLFLGLLPDMRRIVQENPDEGSETQITRTPFVIKNLSRISGELEANCEWVKA